MVLWVIEEKKLHLVSILQLWIHVGLVSIQKVTVMASFMQRNLQLLASDQALSEILNLGRSMKYL